MVKGNSYLIEKNKKIKLNCKKKQQKIKFLLLQIEKNLQEIF